MRALVAVLLALVLAAPAAGDIGKPSYRLDADSSFDPYANETAWLRSHVEVIKGYGSFAREHYVKAGLPTIDYHDAATEGYTPLTPERRAAYLAKVESDKAQGFVGVFNDDVNFGLSYRDGSQNKSAYEPEAKELGLLIEEERAKWPTAIIESNTQWHDLKARLGDSSVQAMIAATTLITKEFGVGPTAGITTKADYESLLAFAGGHGMVFSGDGNSRTVDTMEYNLATELLVSNGRDYVNTSGAYKLPPTWWTGSDVDLGEPQTSETNPKGVRNCFTDGLCARFFTGGVAYVLMPGSAPVSWGNPFGYCSSEWGCPLRWELHERQGIVAH